MKSSSYRLPYSIAVACIGLVVASCGGGDTGGSGPKQNPVATVTISSQTTQLLPGATVQLNVTTRDANGAVVSGRTVTWSSTDPNKATVSSSGLVTGIAVGTTTIVATSESVSGSTVIAVIPPVASVVIAPDSTDVTLGATLQLAATIRDGSNAVLVGRQIAWSSSNQSVAAVSANGLVTTLNGGRATITATSEGKSGSAVVRVSSARDFSIVGVQFTQGVQDTANSLPIVLSGGAVAVNVLLKGAPALATPMQIVLRLFTSGGTLIRTDTATTSGTIGASAGVATPTAQFLVPSSALQAGMRWQVVRDPKGVVSDDTASNDVYPRTGTQALATVNVPPLNVRFVPIVLAANGNTAPTITQADIPEYLHTLRSVHPIGEVNAHVGTAFATSASFGTAPNGGDATFWTQLISELDAARIADPNEPTINWYGIVAPPAGFTFTSFGGFSYVPASAANTGPHTRTSASIRLNWFNRPTQARDLVAHELGHTFGRQHTPCGGAGAPLDPNYPVPGGVIDFVGHDVYSWANGLATSAAAVSMSSGDIMGYCFPAWSSVYTARAILNFRQQTIVAVRANVVPARTRVLMIRGVVRLGQSLSLSPAFSLDALPALPDASGPYTVDGLGSDGRVLFSYSLTPATIDHVPDVRHFTLAVPLNPDVESALDRVRVTGPEGVAYTPRSAAAPRFMPGAPSRAVVSRLPADGMLSVACSDPAAQGVLAIDSATGTVLGTSASASMRALVASGRTVTVLCSDGVRTRSSSLAAP